MNKISVIIAMAIRSGDSDCIAGLSYTSSMCFAGRMTVTSRKKLGRRLSSNIIPLKKRDGKNKSCDTTTETLSLPEHIPIRSPINVEDTMPTDNAKANVEISGGAAPNNTGAVSDITDVMMVQ
jgi:hypothetical protein